MTKITEDLILSNYTITEKFTSRIDSSGEYTLTNKMCCPHCKAILQICKMQRCKDCGLIMEIFGNCLRCTLIKE